MANSGILNKIFALSPIVEIVGRRLYWNNIGALATMARTKKGSSANENTSAGFGKIEQHLSSWGLRKGELLLVHSAYAPLQCTGLEPNEILGRLLEMVGSAGTLAMPAIPVFRNSPKKADYLEEPDPDKVFVYDVQKSPIQTGVLPKLLAKKDGAIRSRHPINTMVAVGPLAANLVEDNLLGKSPLACGVTSSWKKCVDADAVVVGLGTDLTHSLTMIHVAEDMLDESWPIQPWYAEKKFVIKDREFHREVTLRERLPKWGALHFGERTLCKDLIKSGILTTAIIDGVLVEVLRARELVDFLNSKNAKGYPYFWTKWN